MKKIFKLFAAVLSAAVAVSLMTVTSFAYSAGIIDDAGLYTESQLQELEARQEEVANHTGWNIAVVTTNTGFGESNRMAAVDYAENYYEELFGSLNEDGILYLVDLDWRHIVLCGEVDTEYFDQTRKDAMHDMVEELYQNYDDVGSLEALYNNLEAYYDAGPYYTSSFIYGKSIFSVGAFFLCGLIAAIIAIVSVISSYKFKYTPSANAYLDGSKTNFYRRSDRFIREFTTKTKIESSSGGGGGSSGGGHRTGGSSRGGRR